MWYFKNRSWAKDFKENSIGQSSLQVELCRLSESVHILWHTYSLLKPITETQPKALAWEYRNELGDVYAKQYLLLILKRFVFLKIQFFSTVIVKVKRPLRKVDMTPCLVIILMISTNHRISCWNNLTRKKDKLLAETKNNCIDNMVNRVQNVCNPSIHNFQSAQDRIPSNA